MAKVIRVFLDADLRGQHNSLAKAAKKTKLNVENLVSGQYVVFVNRARDRIKIFAANNIIAYYKSPSGRIDMHTIALIPQAFEGPSGLNYDKALRKSLEKRLGV